MPSPQHAIFYDPIELFSLEKNIGDMPLCQIAGLAKQDIRNIVARCAVMRKSKPSWVLYSAPYLDAMLCLNSIDDTYISDSGRSIVLYFLSNSSGWRTAKAKIIKAELKRRAGAK